MRRDTDMCIVGLLATNTPRHHRFWNRFPGLALSMADIPITHNREGAFRSTAR